MIARTILPFKIESSEERLTARAGLALVLECAEAVGLREAFLAELLAAGSNRGYSPWEFGRPLVLMLSDGGRCLEDLRELEWDRGLREATDLRVPSADAAGDWLRRTGAQDGEVRMNRVNRRILRKVFKKSKRKRYTLDIDATFIESHKREALYSYHGEPGYYPMTGWLSEEEVCVGYEFRGGNESPSAGNLEFIRLCEGQLPKGKEIGLVRSDSAAYNSKVIGHCQETGKRFVIMADQDAGVRGSIEAIPASEWKELPWDLGDGYYAETTHAFNAETVEAFRLIAIRRPYQRHMFDTTQEPRERYAAIATDLECGPCDVIRRYNERGQAENLIKELKIGYGMEYMPCGDVGANAVWFGLGVLAYNLGQALKLLGLDSGWIRSQVVTLRWRLYNTAGKLVRHAGQRILRICGGAERLDLFNRVRRRLFEAYAVP